jgi:hypothetical protein
VSEPTPPPGRPGDAPFSRRSAAWLAAVAAGSLAVSAFLGAYGELLGDPPTWRADGFSRSAIGHRAFLDLARRLGLQVLTSRHRTASHAADDVVTVLLEPDLGEEAGPARARLVDVAAAAGQLLLVLPKRTGPPDPLRPGWLGEAALVTPAAALAPLRALGDEDAWDLALEARLVRLERAPSNWRGELPAPSLPSPQLLVTEALTPLLWSDQGMLVGELTSGEFRVVVVSDPDLLSTHGLGRGDNAVVALRLLERLGAPARPLVVDETLHGLEIQPSITRELLRFPLLLATLQALLAAALAAWAASVRFGRPRPAPRALQAGTAFLVESTAGLLQHGGHAGHALAAYWRDAREEVLRRLHGRGEPAADPDRALRRLLEARGEPAALLALDRLSARVAAVQGRPRQRGAEDEAARTALAIHRWREELTDGA